jgi:hypothetical protein
VKPGLEDLDPANWMHVIRQHCPGNRKLSSLTIPGTHNSFARVGSVEAAFTSVLMPLKRELSDFVRIGAECQTYGISEQLHMGIRYIDLRTSGTDLRLRHGRAGLKDDLRGALDTITRFLDEHPDETVLVQAKRDMESLKGAREDETPETRKAVEDLFSTYPRHYTDIKDPSLDDCRGKMVLLVADHATKGINISPRRDGAPNISGDDKNREKHWREVVQRLEWNAENASVDDGFWYQCGCNAYWFPHLDVYHPSTLSHIQYTQTPRDRAEYLNWRLSELIADRYWYKPYRFGLVELDFAYPTLVKQLLLTNFG